MTARRSILLDLLGAIVLGLGNAVNSHNQPFPSCDDAMLAVHIKAATHTVSKLIMGCHLDSGYGYGVPALFSQMIYASSFELGPPSLTNPTSHSLENATLPSDRPNGVGWIPFGVLDRIAFKYTGGLAHGAGVVTLESRGAGIANRGLGMEGLHFEAGRNYEGFIVAKTAGRVLLVVSLEDFSRNVTLGQVSIPFAGNEWTKLEFNITSSSGTPCVDTKPWLDGLGPTCERLPGNDGDDAAHICVRCPGQLSIHVQSGGSVDLGFVSLQPGAWGRLEGLPVLQSGVAALKKMGVTLIRAGGSFAKAFPEYSWKRWLGGNKPWLREPYTWGGPTSKHHPHGVHEIVSGFGPFEILDMSSAIGVEVVIALAAVGASAEDMGDLVEYCYGNLSTTWGQRRIETDQHPEVYPLRWIELGNEQDNPLFVEQVRNMEDRASKLGLRGVLKYIYPRGGGSAGVGGPTNASEAHESLKLGLGNRLVVDVHTYEAGGVKAARDVFSDSILGPGGWSSINLETNCGDHTMRRALTEAQDIMTFLSYPNPRLLGRAASFCMQRSGYNEGGLNDQGLAFYLPNMTWLQPSGHVHSMLHQMWQPVALNVSLQGCQRSVCGTASGIGGAGTRCALATAQASEDGSKAVVQLLNMGAREIDVSLSIDGVILPAVVRGLRLSADSLAQVNAPARPNRISPVEETIHLSGGHFRLPGLTFLILEIRAPQQHFV